MSKSKQRAGGGAAGEHDMSLTPERGGADAKELIEEIAETVAGGNEFISRMEQSREVARCIWSDQSSDGRKWGENREDEHYSDGRKIFPWPGASDCRVRLAEEVVGERKLIQKAAYAGARMQALGREANDGPAAAAITQVLAYLGDHAMGRELDRQIDLLLDFTHTYGHAVCGVSWLKELERYAIDVSLPDLEARAAAAAAAGVQAAAHGTAVDGAAVEEAAGVAARDAAARVREAAVAGDRDALAAELRAAHPEADPKSAAHAAKALARGVERTFLFASRLRQDRPQWRALLPWVSVFYPLETESMETARWVAEVMWLDRTTLKARAAAEGWDEQWVKEVLDRPGNHFSLADGWYSGWSEGAGGVPGWVGGANGVSSIATDEGEGQLYQLFDVHYRAAPDGADGTLLRRAILHPDIDDRFGYEGPAPYAHGRMPYFELRTETREPSLFSARGVPEIVLTDQYEVKLQRDARADGTTISTFPPLDVPPNQAGGRIRIRPLAQIVNTRGAHGRANWFDPPPVEGHRRSAEVEASVRAGVAAYFRRPQEGVDPVLVQQERRELAADFLSAMAEGVTLTAALVRQYLPPEVASRIVGAPVDLGAGSRAELQGNYDFRLEFDARDLDHEWVAAKVKAVLELAVPLDHRAVVDYAELARLALTSIDPQLAARVVKPPGQAAESEIEDEQAALAQILVGLEPKMRIGGQDHQARADHLIGSYQGNPVVRQAVDAGGQPADLFRARLQHHLHQVQQQTNAVTGRTGAEASGLPGPNAAGPAPALPA